VSRRKGRRPPESAKNEPETAIQPVVGELVPQETQPLELLNDPRHVRGEARTLAQYLQLGVVPEDKAKRYLARVYELLDTEVSTREFTALSKVVVALAKLGLDIEKLNTPKKHQHAHIHATAHIDDGGNRVPEIFARLRASSAPDGTGQDRS
jgi:hypothetical protein